MFDNGIYIGANIVDEDSLVKINEVRNMIRSKISDRVGLTDPHYDPHITIMYSTDKPEGDIEVSEFPEKIDISFSSIDVFNYNYRDINGSCIVLKVESKAARSLHDAVKKINKVNPTYNKYEPHITLFLVDGILPDDLKKKINNLLNVPNVKFDATCQYDVEDLDKD